MYSHADEDPSMLYTVQRFEVPQEYIMSILTGTDVRRLVPPTVGREQPGTKRRRVESDDEELVGSSESEDCEPAADISEPVFDML